MSTAILRRHRKPSAARGASSASRLRGSRRLGLEQLEDRRLLSLGSPPWDVSAALEHSTPGAEERTLLDGYGAAVAPRGSWGSAQALNTNADTDSGDDAAPQITTDGAGHWVAVWYSDDSLGGTIGTDLDILVSRSSDNGQTWTAPAALNSNAATDGSSEQDFSPQVTTDGAGHWVAAWSSTNDLGGTIGADFDILVSRSNDNGQTWTAPAALNSNAATDSDWDDSPQVTTDGAGHWVAVWHSGDFGIDYDILISRSSDNGQTWTAPAALNTNAGTDSGNDFHPEVTTDGAGHWVAVWVSNDSLGATIGTDYDVLVSRSVDNGQTWTAPAALNTNADTDVGADEYAQVTTDGAGHWVAVWYSKDDLGGTIGTDRDILISRSADNGQTWTAPAALNTNADTDSGDDFAPQLTTDGAGHWRAVWRSNDDLDETIGTDKDILASQSSDNGQTWTAPAALNSNAAADSGDDISPQLATNGAGHWIAVWQSNDGLGGTIGTDSDILFAPAIPGGRDDVIIDFGGAGLWVWQNNTTWYKLHGISPEAVATGDLDDNGQEEAIVDFGAAGLWVWQNNATWYKLHATSPEVMVTGDLDGNGQEEAIIDFGTPGGLWVWQNNTTWYKLHGMDPESMVTGDLDGNGKDEVIIDFGEPGLWVWQNNATWYKLHGISPDLMVTGDLDGNGKDEAIIDFGTPGGIWVRENNTTWYKLHGTSAELMAAGDLDGNGKDEVIIDFGLAGLWVRENNTTWSKLHSMDVGLMSTGNLDGL